MYNYNGLPDYVKHYYEQYPDQLYSYYVQNQKMSDSYRRALSGQQNRVFTDWLHKAAQNPQQFGAFGDYLHNINGKQLVRSLSPQQRGVDLRTFSSPVRWMSI